MILKSQSMRFVMATMMDVEHEWQTSKWKDKSDMVLYTGYDCAAAIRARGQA